MSLVFGFGYDTLDAVVVVLVVVVVIVVVVVVRLPPVDGSGNVDCRCRADINKSKNGF